jgi:hypothetical protein
MSEQQTSTEWPSIFDSKGGFVPLPESILDHMPKPALAMYQTVADAFNAQCRVDNAIEQTTKLLHGLVKELRDAEARLERMPRQNHTDLVREMIYTARQYGG